MTALIFSEREEDLEVDHLTERDGDDEVDVESVTVGDQLDSGGRLHGRLVSIGCPKVDA
jgi:hypothetical protein